MEKIALSFGQPLWLYALVLLPVFFALFWWAQRRNDALVARIVAPRLRAALSGSVSRERRWAKHLLLIFSLGCIIIALSQPRYGYRFREVKTKGRDVIIALDTSRSMLATDIAPNRLTRAKLVAQDLVQLTEGDRVGLIAFAGSAFLQAPLTLDYTAVVTSLDEMDTRIIPKGGTNIAAAIRMGIEAFGKAEGATRALVIITDGEELDADGVAAAKEAAKDGVRIFTVGVGSAEGSVIPVEAERGGTELVRDQSGNPVRSKLDTARLQEIAKETGGFYEPLSQDAAKNILKNGIEPMETRESGSLTSRMPIERYEWVLAPGIATLMLSLLIGDKRGKRRTPARNGVSAAVAGVLMLFSMSAFAQTNPGVEQYKAEDYKAALGSFENDLKRLPDNAAVEFNAGAAAYKTGDYDQALEYFTKALLTEDEKLREKADYNLGNALVRKGEKAPQRDQKITHWKDAIQHYDEVLKRNPENAEAKHNKEIIEKLLKEEEQKQPPPKQDQKKDDKKDDKQDQKQDQQKQDQQKKDEQDKKDQQDKQDQQNQEDQKKDEQQSGKGQEGKDKQSGEGQDQKESEQKKDSEQGKQDEQKEEKQNEQQSGNESQPQKNNPGDEQNGQPSPTPGPKKEGELKSGQEEKQAGQSPTPQEAAEAQAAEEDKDGKMSTSQAKALLRALQGEEERVRLIDRKMQEDTKRDW